MGSLFSAAEEAAEEDVPPTWRLGGEREAMARKTNGAAGGALR